jgi:hypothetical protein
MSAGQTKATMPLNADQGTRLQARANCAARKREKGEESLALAFEAGTQDDGWAMRHEVNRMRAEKAGAEA